MAKVYNQDGWVNWPWILNQGAVFNMVVGARGTGKTYGIMRYLIENHLPFIYMRRLKTQLDICGKPTGNPFRKICIDLGMNIIPFSTGGNIEFRKDDRTGQIVAVGVALSTIATIRGIDFSEYSYIVFDEAIPMTGEKPIRGEFESFLNFYETVNRNRELSGDKPVQAVLLGNANRLNNAYFSGWKFTKTALKMIHGKQMVYRNPDKTRMMILLLDSPISKRKRDTALYSDSNSSESFIDMAIDNAFRTDETVIHSEPLTEYIHVVSIGEIGIYRHKSERRFYVSEKTGYPYYDDFGIGLKMFRNDYMMLRITYMVRKNVIFENYECELLFREYFDLI